MKKNLILPILYDGLSNRLNGAVIRIEPIKEINHTTSASVVFCRVRLENSHEIYVWIKTLTTNSKSNVKEKQIIRDYDLTQHLYNMLDKSGAFLVPRPLFYSAANRLMVTEHMPGKLLQNKILEGTRWMPAKARQRSLEKDCYQAGRWLRAFQEATRDYCPGMSHGLELMRVKNTERIATQTAERVDQLTRQNSNLLRQDLIFSIKEFLTENLAKAQQNRNGENEYICSVHGDYFPGNLLSNGNAVVGLDFTGSTWGSRYHDLSYFVFQIETLCAKVRCHKYLERLMVSAFINGYGDIEPDEDFWKSNPEIENNLVSHCVSRLLYLYDSKWSPLSPRFFYRKIGFYKTRRRLIQHIAY